ncbi:MAG: hypothetical protein WCD35_06005 [Mycobacteriales bacterium]
MAPRPADVSSWCPPELTAAAAPLRSTAHLLRALAEDSRGLERLVDSSPRQAVREALAAFVERWELVLWSVSGDADSLGHLLQWAAQAYRGSEADLVRRLVVQR